MPYLKLDTNVSVSSEKSTQLLKELSKLVALEVGKPERYVMIEINDKKAMLFAGSDEPLAYLECKSIGLPSSKTKPLSTAICQLLNTQLSISPDRIYIEFSNAEATHWGWNSSTFG